MTGSAQARPTTGPLESVLGVGRTATWVLVLNCLQNLALAPRAVAGAAVVGRPRISVLVPARDESANIAECVRGLLAQSYPATEILVLDDHSTDDTAAIVRGIGTEQGDGRLRLLPGRERPDGWIGKHWACHQLAEAAVGDWLLFVDADTRHRPDSIAATLALAQQYDADLLSLLPRQITASLGERVLVSQLPLIIHAFLPIALVLRKERWARPFAGAFGPCFLFRRIWYKELGGFASVHGFFAEDMRFAVATKRRGGQLVLADGTTVVACRMYRSFVDAWLGMARNALPAALGSPAIYWSFVAAWAALFVLPPATVIALAARRLTGRPPASPSMLRLALGATAGQLALRLAVGRHHRWSLRDVALQPLGAMLTLGVLIDSWCRHRTSAVTWRGRRYS
jgi:chlorobactene glucosyltransferase